MRRSLGRPSRTLFGTALGTLLALGGCSTVSAQEVEIPEVVSKMVSVGPDEARLTLELSSGASMELAFADGVVRMGDEVLGNYTPGGALDLSWRELVAGSLQLEDESLLQALVDWSPPEGLDGTASEVAVRVDEFLDANFDTAAIRALALEAAAEAEALEDALVGIRGLESLSSLSALQALSGLGEALSDLGPRVQVVIDDHFEVPAGSEVRSSVLVVDGTLEVRGTIRGDVMVVDGEIDMRPGSRIAGALSLAEAEFDNDGGEVAGGIRRLTPDRMDLEARIRAEVMDELRGIETQSRDRRHWTSPFGGIARGIGGILSILFKILILGAIGMAFLHFAEPNMDAVAEVARDSTGRAALVGAAGGILAFPVWILGMVALAVTIIGLPVILLWIPLFPLAVGMGWLMGYLAVARNLGVWLSQQDYPWTDWVRVTNPATLVFGGLVVLMAPFAVAYALDMVGFLGMFSGLFTATGWMMNIFAGAVGLGAVMLTRGGRRPEEWGTEMFTRSWRDIRWGRNRDWEAEAFDAEIAEERARHEPDEAPEGAPEGEVDDRVDGDDEEGKEG